MRVREKYNIKIKTHPNPALLIRPHFLHLNLPLSRLAVVPQALLHGGDVLLLLLLLRLHVALGAGAHAKGQDLAADNHVSKEKDNCGHFC